ncbi:cytochrome c oxidase assembly protein [Kocuria rhizophila]|nr:cytochrome c oxidase assembly protein [Kocuria rhizophila]
MMGLRIVVAGLLALLARDLSGCGARGGRGRGGHGQHGGGAAGRAERAVAARGPLLGVTSCALVLLAAVAYCVCGRGRRWRRGHLAPGQLPRGTGRAWAPGPAGPVAQAGHASFTMHMAGHLLVGMIGPLPRWAPRCGAAARAAHGRGPQGHAGAAVPVDQVVMHPAVAAGAQRGRAAADTTGRPLDARLALGHAVVHTHIFRWYQVHRLDRWAGPGSAPPSFRVRAAVLAPVDRSPRTWPSGLVRPSARGGGARGRGEVGVQPRTWWTAAPAWPSSARLFLGYHRATAPREPGARHPEVTARDRRADRPERGLWPAPRRRGHAARGGDGRDCGCAPGGRLCGPSHCAHSM